LSRPWFRYEETAYKSKVLDVPIIAQSIPNLMQFDPHPSEEQRLETTAGKRL